jgi:predicted lipoprotein with Yx(FWY)xxD motif
MGNAHHSKGDFMARLIHHRRLRRVHVAVVIAAVAGLASAALVGLAVAKTVTLQAAKSASVTNQSGSTKTEGIVVNSKGRAVYTLSGDTTRHPKCTKAGGCFQFWPPVTVSSGKSLSKAAGVKGKLGTFKRNGITQVTLAGHPLYTFSNDHQKNNATGEGVNAFGGIWHVVKDAGGSSSSSPTTSTSTTSSTTTTNPYGY